MSAGQGNPAAPVAAVIGVNPVNTTHNLMVKRSHLDIDMDRTFKEVETAPFLFNSSFRGYKVVDPVPGAPSQTPAVYRLLHSDHKMGDIDFMQIGSKYFMPQQCWAPHGSRFHIRVSLHGISIRYKI